MWSRYDEEYWLKKETEIIPFLVDLANHGFVIDHDCYRKGWTKDPRCLIRPAVAEALVKAKSRLPAGYNFKIYDGWRSREEQVNASKETEDELRTKNPGWSEDLLEKELQKFCPRPRGAMMDFGRHRFGGAVDLTIIDPIGDELNMGCRVNEVVPQSSLLYYERIENISLEQIEVRNNRRILISVMEFAEFMPLLCEWWHWGYAEDLFYSSF